MARAGFRAAAALVAAWLCGADQRAATPAWAADPPASIASPTSPAATPSTTPSPAPSAQELFERAFRNRPGGVPERRASLPVELDHQVVGEVQAIVPGDPAKTRVEAKPLIALLAPVLAPDRLARLGQQADPAGFLLLATVAAEGLAARFDEQRLAIVIEIPADDRRTRDVGLRGVAPRLLPEGLAPTADFSSYLNMRTGLDYVHEAGPGQLAGRQPLNTTFETGTNLFGNVLEGTVHYTESASPPWQRGDFRLIHDDPDNAVRYMAGDLVYPLGGFQQFQTMGGISIAKNFSLQPYRVVQPSGQQQILLQSDSRVDVVVNGQPTQSIRLPPGRYNFRDFPFVQGVNDVQLRVTDSVGRVQVIDLPFFFSTNLLSAGIHEYAYSLGAPSTLETGGYAYRSGVPAFSAYHRYGISDDLTVGANVQGDGNIQMAGAEIGVATPVGAARVDLATSHSPFGNDSAARLTYEFFSSSAQVDKRSTDYRSLIASAEYDGRKFARLGDVEPNNPFVLNLAVRYSQTLFADITATLGENYRIGYPGQRDTTSTTASVRQWITRNVAAQLDLSRNVDTFGHEEYRAFVSFSLLTTDPRQFAQASYDTHDRASRVDYQYTPDYDVRQPFATASVAHSRITDQVNGSAGFNDYRFETALVHDETMPGGRGDPSLLDRRTGIRFGTALVFADGHFAMSRPITDSFAMVVAHPTLADQRVGADPSGINYRAEADWLGPAVVPNLTAYQTRTMQVAVPELPIGLDLGRDTFQIHPSYRSGSVLKVGTDATVLADGVLLGDDGKPLALIAGKVTPLDMAGATGHDFFTNRTGRFRIEGLKPGAYELRVPADSANAVRLEIPAGTTGIYRLGTITIGGARS